MAVTGETAKYKLPYFKPGDSPPDMAAVTKAISERVEALLAKGGDVSIAADGTITISNEAVDAARITKALKPSGTAAAGTEALRALGATASTACAGNDSRLSDERTPKANSVTSAKIEDGSVAEGDLADKAVTSRKAKLTCGQVEATENLTIASEAFADVVGAELKITPAVASLLKVTAVFDVEGGSAGSVIIGGLNLDGVDQTRVAVYKTGTANTQTMITQTYVLALSVAAHTIKLRGRRNAGEGGKILSAHTGFMYELVAS